MLSDDDKWNIVYLVSTTFADEDDMFLAPKRNLIS